MGKSEYILKRKGGGGEPLSCDYPRPNLKTKYSERYQVFGDNRQFWWANSSIIEDKRRPTHHRIYGG